MELNKDYQVIISKQRHDELLNIEKESKKPKDHTVYTTNHSFYGGLFHNTTMNIETNDKAVKEIAEILKHKCERNNNLRDEIKRIIDVFLLNTQIKKTRLFGKYLIDIDDWNTIESIAKNYEHPL